MIKAIPTAMISVTTSPLIHMPPSYAVHILPTVRAGPRTLEA
jgi:hypothetical protein